MPHEIALLVNLSLSLVVALVLGLVTERLRLSPIVGYLCAGVALGPQTPGFVADAEMAQQFAEIGVVLLMFGVGLHFNRKDLWAVRKVAVPGAVAQITTATIFGCLAVASLGYGISQGIIIGVAISVASTVVLVRMLTDNDVLHTPQGHIAVGWLVLEDIFTVLVLVALPAFASFVNGDGENQQSIATAIGMALLRMAVLSVIVLGAGKRLIPWLLELVAKTRSRELFTLAVLSLALSIAVASSYFFGVSMALGAFLAGMVVGQTNVSHQAAADALPMRDAFAVLFFVAVGMLLDFRAITTQPVLLAMLLAAILLVKPITAFLIVWLLRHTFRSAITISFALAQVGEFSFLLADEAIRHNLLTHSAYSLLVACAIVTITLNPLLFRTIKPLERWLRRKPAIWRILSKRSELDGAGFNEQTKKKLAAAEVDDATPIVRAVIAGYGPVGQTAMQLLRDFGVETTVVDLNLDTVRNLVAEGKLAVYGDSTRRDILEAAGIGEAKYLLVTVPDVLVRTLTIMTAKELNADLKVFARARYLREGAWLEEIGATEICTEEAETAIGLARLLLREMDADEGVLRDHIQRIHDKFGIIQTRK
jgi:CPA2 family monovalent cation:H+ antiporter-2